MCGTLPIVRPSSANQRSLLAEDILWAKASTWATAPHRLEGKPPPTRVRGLLLLGLAKSQEGPTSWAPHSLLTGHSRGCLVERRS
jgi:hypothetical protein